MLHARQGVKYFIGIYMYFPPNNPTLWGYYHLRLGEADLHAWGHTVYKEQE